MIIHMLWMRPSKWLKAPSNNPLLPIQPRNENSNASSFKLLSALRRVYGFNLNFPHPETIQFLVFFSRLVSLSSEKLSRAKGQAYWRTWKAWGGRSRSFACVRNKKSTTRENLWKNRKEKEFFHQQTEAPEAHRVRRNCFSACASCQCDCQTHDSSFLYDK